MNNANLTQYRQQCEVALEDGKLVYCRDGIEAGVIRGRRACSMEDCSGTCLRVVWPDGSWTWPCSRAMTLRADGALQIC